MVKTCKEPDAGINPETSPKPLASKKRKKEPKSKFSASVRLQVVEDDDG
jgi:hypothetical protein